MVRRALDLARLPWERYKRSLFPPGAVLWPLEAWRRTRLSTAQQERALALRHALGLDRLWILHGGAVGRNGSAIALCGPMRIGKSSLLFALEREGEAELLEEGLLLMGRAGTGWRLVRTGTLAFMRTHTRISRALRRLTPARRLPLEATDSGSTRARLDQTLVNLSFRIAVLAHRRGAQREFAPNSLPLSRLVHAASPGDPHLPVRVEDNGELVADAAFCQTLPGAIEVPLGESPNQASRDELQHRLRAALLAEADWPSFSPKCASAR